MKLITYLEKFNLLDRVEAAAGAEFYDVKQWNFAINYRAKSRYGCCKPQQKLVEVTSEYYVHGGIKEGEQADFENTLLHETAHVIVHERFGALGNKVKDHGVEWKRVMRDLGITRIKRTGKSEVLKREPKPPKHLYTCKDCGIDIPRQRELKDYKVRYHPKCKRKPNGGALNYQRMC